MAESKPTRAVSFPQLNILPVEYRDLAGCPGHRLGTDGSLWTQWIDIRNSRGHVEYVRVEDWHRLTTSKPTRTCKYWTIRIKAGLCGKLYRSILSVAVLRTFVSERPDGLWACHFDGNPNNNWLYNLRWDTRVANEQDKKRHGTDNSGERNGMAKWPDALVSKIHARWLELPADKSGKRLGSHRIISKEFGIPYDSVGPIIERAKSMRT